MNPTLAPLLNVKDFAFIYVECAPSNGANNARYEHRTTKKLSKQYKLFRKAVWIAWLKVGKPEFRCGPVGMEIVAYWDRESRELDYQTAYADVDAIDKGTLDALQPSKDVPGMTCLDTDMRVEPLVLRKRVDKKNPRVEVLIWESHDER